MIAMLRRHRRLAVVTLSALMGLQPLVAHANCRENAMIVFDASGSMSGPSTGGRRLDVARRAIDDVLPEVTTTRPTGLVTYGGAFSFGCESVELKLPPTPNSASLIRSQLLGLEPGGQTPVSEATWLAAQALDHGTGNGTIVVITDGRENCGFDACMLGTKLKTEAPRIKVHVIGFHLMSRSEQSVACLARTTGGTYTSTRGLDQLRAALRKSLTCPRISRAPDLSTSRIR